MTSEEFDTWYKSLHTPAPTESFNLSLAMLTTILTQDRGVVSSVSQSIARGNDIASLKLLMENIDKVRQAAGTNDMTGTLPLEFPNSLTNLGAQAPRFSHGVSGAAARKTCHVQSLAIHCEYVQPFPIQMQRLISANFTTREAWSGVSCNGSNCSAMRISILKSC